MHDDLSASLPQIKVGVGAQHVAFVKCERDQGGFPPDRRCVGDIGNWKRSTSFLCLHAFSHAPHFNDAITTEQLTAIGERPKLAAVALPVVYSQGPREISWQLPPDCGLDRSNLARGCRRSESREHVWRMRAEISLDALPASAQSSVSFSHQRTYLPNVPAFSCERQREAEGRPTSSSAATPCWAAARTTFSQVVAVPGPVRRKPLGAISCQSGMRMTAQLPECMPRSQTLNQLLGLCFVERGTEAKGL